jgi:Holliday junction resolvasome RuvABC ATP-dependent DNA helicase subunit
MLFYHYIANRKEQETFEKENFEFDESESFLSFITPPDIPGIPPLNIPNGKHPLFYPGEDDHSKTLYDIYSEMHLREINDIFFKDYLRNEDYALYVSARTETQIECIVAVNLDARRGFEWEQKIEETFPECKITSHREITVEEFRNEISESGFGSSGRIMERLNIKYSSTWMDPFPFKMEQYVPEKIKMNKTECKKRAKKILASQSFLEEIDRIYSKENQKTYYGHPVHYVISAGDWGAARDIYELLLAALGTNGRLLSGRQMVLRDFHGRAYKDERVRQVLEAAEGGVAIVELNLVPDIGQFATDFHELTKYLGSILETQKKDTLFIFVEIMGKNNANDEAVSNITGKADFIQICEGSGTEAQAKDYLMELTENVDFAAEDRSDALNFLPEQESYTVTDIYKAYNAWYGSGLKNHVYKAYKTKESFRVKITEKESGPYDKLREMIGLTKVKNLVDQIVDSAKVLRARERMGLSTEGCSLHMLFSGNPGTAKTTVARLIADILKDQDVIKSGRFVECGRQDLVGRYVGWTAKIVESKFREARGGVLFIDEAYALVDDSNSFGAEAINTIVQLMENYRNDVIVIFAGYSDKMKTFIAQNEGIRSRIAFHLDFPDYTADELLDILRLHTKYREYTLDSEAEAFCRGLFTTAGTLENFGNGRYVRNVLDHAILAQSGRLVRSAGDRELTKDEMCLLTKEDFAADTPEYKPASVRMGFGV